MIPRGASRLGVPGSLSTTSSPAAAASTSPLIHGWRRIEGRSGCERATTLATPSWDVGRLRPRGSRCLLSRSTMSSWRSSQLPLVKCSPVMLTARRSACASRAPRARASVVRRAAAKSDVGRRAQGSAGRVGVGVGVEATTSLLPGGCARETGGINSAGGDEDDANDHEDRHDHADQSDHDIERHQRSRPTRPSKTLRRRELMAPRGRRRRLPRDCR